MYKKLACLCIALGLIAMPVAVQAQQSTGAPENIILQDAMPKPVDMVPMPPALGQDSPPEGYAAAAAAASGTPLDDMSANTAPQPEPTPGADAQIDLAAQCHQTNAEPAAVSACLETVRNDLEQALKTAQDEALKKSDVATDWQASRNAAQRLASSTMSFDAYRTSECLRRHQSMDEWNQIPKTDEYMTCEIQLTQARIQSLKN